MFKVAHTIHHDHDLGLVLLAGLLCAFGCWVVSRLYQHALGRPRRQALIWYFLTAITAGVAVWCTHFIAILAYQPSAPVTFNLQLTFVSLLIAIAGSTVGIMVAGMFRSLASTIIGGTIFGVAVSAMHYTGMVAYRVEGVVTWDRGYLIGSVILAVVLSTAALYLGSRSARWSGLQMTGVLTLAIIGLHFTGMAAFSVDCIGLKPGYTNPEEYKLLALVIAGTATTIPLGGLFTYFIENRTRMESIEELRKARDAAEGASRAKSEFMSVLSHELRTPLTSIKGALGLLEAQTQDDPDAGAVRLVQIATANCDRLVALVNDILDMEKINAGSMTVVPKPEKLGDIVTLAAEQVEPYASEWKVEIDVDTPDPDHHVLTDKNRIMQVLTNLLSNACKFAYPETAVTVTTAPVGDMTKISVTNLGNGISEEFRERIFQPFSQAEASNTRQRGGTGLGLNISRHLVEAMGGEIGFDSVPGEETVFWFTCPSTEDPDVAMVA